MYMKLYEHSSKNNILAEEHFGFRTKSATNNAIYKLTNEILIALNNKFMVGGTFCDLEEAFDCVNHKILLSKLEFYSVRGKAKLWFESYFRNRYQRVLITNNVLNQNYFSTWEEIKHGVPQGSSLGPLLFLFYINDLPKAINNKSIPIMFADDTSILITSPNKYDFQIKITAVLNFINEWLNTNLLSTNFNKTHYIQFTTKNKPKTHIKVTYYNKQITTISNIKFLGIYVNDTINWKYHIEYIL